MPTRSRTGWLLAALAGLLLGGCDVKTDVTLRPASDEALQERVTQLESDLAGEKARADRLQRQLAGARETNVVSAGDEKFAFRINTPAAVVLVFTVLAIAAVWIARIRYGVKEPDA